MEFKIQGCFTLKIKAAVCSKKLYSSKIAAHEMQNKASVAKATSPIHFIVNKAVTLNIFDFCYRTT